MVYVYFLNSEFMFKMKTYTATEAKQSFWEVMTSIESEPIAISKSNREYAVFLSAGRYKELKRLEDLLYIKASELAISEGLLSSKESKSLLGEM